jgi:16S rRNA (cytosine967-C5)-methyltransferase
VTGGSLPSWLAERWLARLGPAAAVARARAALEKPPHVFRFNPRRTDAAAQAEAAGLTWRPLDLPGAFQSESGPVSDLAECGVLYLQDVGSQMVARLAARPGRTLDACAAPGGKAMLLGDLATGGDLVVAAELSPSRLRTLRELVARWGSTNVAVVGADARRPPFHATFDTVLLDAPCSGLGTLARHPDIRWRIRAADLERQAERQRALLESQAPLVRPGGTLVYATCSGEPEENEQVVASFLQAHPEFTAAPPPDWAAAHADGPWLRTRPERDGGDAFTATRLERH